MNFFKKTKRFSIEIECKSLLEPFNSKVTIFIVRFNNNSNANDRLALLCVFVRRVVICERSCVVCVLLCQGFTTMILNCSVEIINIGYAWKGLKEHLGEEIDDQIKRMTFLKDKKVRSASVNTL